MNTALHKAKNQLDLRRTMALGTLIQERYASAGLTDAGFAALAQNLLGGTITQNNVFSVRSALKIESTREIKIRENKAKKPESQFERIIQTLEKLEERIQAIEKILGRSS